MPDLSGPSRAVADGSRRFLTAFRTSAPSQRSNFTRPFPFPHCVLTGDRGMALSAGTSWSEAERGLVGRGPSGETIEARNRGEVVTARGTTDDPAGQASRLRACPVAELRGAGLMWVADRPREPSQ